MDSTQDAVGPSTQARSEGVGNLTASGRRLKACESCRKAKIRCLPVVGAQNDVCSRCTALQILCTYPPSQRGRKTGSKNRRTLAAADGGFGSVPIDSGHEVSPAPTSQPYLLDLPLSFRETLPIDDNDRDPQPSAAVRHNELSPRDFRGALQAIVEAASTLAARETQPEPRLPDIAIPEQDAALLHHWTSERLKKVLTDQKRFYRYGQYGSKRDVDPSLDPVAHKLLDESRVTELFAAFWQHIHPYCTILDPRLHTPTFVRSRSAFLFTVILTYGSIILATKPNSTKWQVEEANRLKAHMDRLNLVVYMAGAKSIEIIQATMICTDNSLARTKLVDDDRWMRFAAAQKMAEEVGLHLPRTARDGDGLLRLNDLRTRAWLLVIDTKYAIFHGGTMSSMGHIELKDEERAYMDHISPYGADASLPAFYDLHMFQRRILIRLQSANPDADLALEAEHLLVDKYIDRWVDKWCPKDGDEMHNWMFRYEAMGARLLLHLRILKYQTLSPLDSPAYRDKILRSSEEIFEDALNHSEIPHFSLRSGNVLFAADLIVKLGGRQDLVLRMALRMAGDPDKPTIRTQTPFNGAQTLAMLSLLPARTEDRHAEEPMDLNDWLATFDASVVPGPDPDPALIPPLASTASNPGPSPEDAYDWTGLLALSTASLDQNLIGIPQPSWQEPVHANASSSTGHQPQPSLLGFQDFQPLAQIIAQGVSGEESGGRDVQARVMEVLWQLVSHPQT